VWQPKSAPNKPLSVLVPCAGSTHLHAAPKYTFFTYRHTPLSCSRNAAPEIIAFFIGPSLAPPNSSPPSLRCSSSCCSNHHPCPTCCRGCAFWPFLPSPDQPALKGPSTPSISPALVAPPIVRARRSAIVLCFSAPLAGFRHSYLPSHRTLDCCVLGP
jgi:hypothetical protein